MDRSSFQNRTHFRPALVQSGKQLQIQNIHPKPGPVLSIITCCIISIGCNAPVKPPRPHIGALPAVVTADWDDIDAALSRARLRTESLQVNKKISGQGDIGSLARVELISIRDNHIWIEFRTLADWDRNGGPISIEISVGSLQHDDEEYQRIVVGEIAHNLRALAGKDTAPLD